MREPIEDIRTKLRNDEYKNKEHVRFSIVGRMLHNLGWDLWNPREVYPDYVIEISKDQPSIDIALFGTPPVPSVFFEIKAVGTLVTDITQSDLQHGKFDIDTTDLILILTDGQKWVLHCSHELEELSTMCFKTLDMLEDDIDDLATAFDTFLSKSNIVKGKAQREAKNILMQSMREQAVAEVMDKARQMVTEPPYPRLPQAVIELIIPKGITITEDDAIKILEKTETQKPKPEPVTKPEPEPEQKPVQESAPEPEASEPEVETVPEPEPEPEKEPEPAKKEPSVKQTGKIDYTHRQIKSFVFLKKKYSPESWKDMLITFCEIMYKSHSKEFYKSLTLRSTNQRYFSKNKNEFFGNSPVQIGETEYWIMTNLNANQIVKLIYKMMDLFGYKIKDMEINTD